MFNEMYEDVMGFFKNSLPAIEFYFAIYSYLYLNFSYIYLQ